MWKYYAMRIGFVASIGVSGMHYVSNGWVAAEKYVARRYDRIENVVVHELASRRGYAPIVPERKWEQIADEQAELQGLNKCLVRAVIKVESVDGKHLISPAGALGLMQVMRDTARRACDIKNDSDRLDTEQNIYCGVKVLKQNIKDYGLYRGLQVYNAGPNRIGKTKENIEYPHKVLGEWHKCNV